MKKNNRGSLFLYYIIIASLIISAILFSLVSLEWIFVSRVKSNKNIREAYYTAEGETYATVQQLITDPDWPGLPDGVPVYEDTYKRNNVNIQRQVNFMPDDHVVIDIRSDKNGSRRRLVSDFTPFDTTSAKNDVIIVFDKSRSMTYFPGKLSSAQTAAGSLSDYLENGIDQVGAIAFCGTSSWLDLLSFDLTEVKSDITAITETEASSCYYTHLEQALSEAEQELGSSRSRDDATGVMVVLSDGVPNCSSTIACVDPPAAEDLVTIRSQVVDEANLIKAQGIRIYAIAYGSDADTALMNAISSGSGYYYNSPDIDDVEAIFQSIGYHINNNANLETKEAEPD